MADPRQVWNIAADLVRRHGGAAAAVAEHNALRAGAGGSMLWAAVAHAARQLLKGAPEPEERVH